MEIKYTYSIPLQNINGDALYSDLVFQKFMSSVYYVLKKLLRAQGRVFNIRCYTRQLYFQDLLL